MALLVPYIAAWSREVELDPQVLVDPGAGFRFEGEVPGDRDRFGALYRRQAIISGDRGVAQLANVHSRRQRRCMTRMLCQVCGGPPSTTSEGMLFLDQDHRQDWSNWPEQLGTVHPPLCLPCAEESVSRCRHLRGSHVGIRVRDAQPWGVYGLQFCVGPDKRLQEVGKVEMEYGDPGLGWVLASQMIVTLNGCTLVDLDAEFAAFHGQGPR